VADNRQFGTPKAFGDKSAGNRPGDSGHCAQCQAMLADALDGTLAAADLELFDLHMAQCDPCSQLLADARCGAAWLEMLRTPPPEPPAALLERILAQTSAQTSAEFLPALTGASVAPAPAFSGIAALAPGYTAVHGNVVPFRSRVAAAVRASAFAQIVLQPRLIMTAAMALFSIALTMDLTGVRPQDLKASDLSLGSLRRDYYRASTRVVQYYEGLRVVYELESRVRDMESISGNDAPDGSQIVPPANSPSAPPAAQPTPGQPSPANPKAAPHHDGVQPARRKPAPSPGTSRREDLNQGRRNTITDAGDDASLCKAIHACGERGLA
jgi:hypothetical protein